MSKTKKHHISIDEETMTVLRESEVTAKSVKLPPAKLPTPLYNKVNRVLETAGGKWHRYQRAHLFSSDPREMLGLAIATGAILDKKKSTQAFYTPRIIADVVVRHATVDGKTVLEPSAGHGALADACARHHAKSVLCIEFDHSSAEHLLKVFAFEVIETDFLKMRPTGLFDRVVMNPPFTSGQDISHVAHAFDFLKPGGRLVSITSPSWETTQNKKSAAFRLFISAYGRIAERLDSGSFKESGTGIAPIILVLDKPQ